jgi:hypothetical protein
MKYKKSLAFSFATMLFSASCFSGTEIVSTKEHYTKIANCLLGSGAKPKCINKNIEPHLAKSDSELIEVTKKMDEMIIDSLGNDSVFAVYPVRHKYAGDYFEEHMLVVEDTSGSPFLISLRYLRYLGKIHVIGINISGGMERVLKILSTAD